MEKLQKYEYDAMKWFCWSLGGAEHSDGVVRASALKVCFETQKQPVFYKKAVLKCFWNIYKKIPVLKSLFNFIKKLQHRCFTVNIAKFLRTSILKNICERLLLKTPRGMNSGNFRSNRELSKLPTATIRFWKKNNFCPSNRVLTFSHYCIKKIPRRL